MCGSSQPRRGQVASPGFPQVSSVFSSQTRAQEPCPAFFSLPRAQGPWPAAQLTQGWYHVLRDLQGLFQWNHVLSRVRKGQETPRTVQDYLGLFQPPQALGRALRPPLAAQETLCKSPGLWTPAWVSKSVLSWTMFHMYSPLDCIGTFILFILCTCAILHEKWSQEVW